MFVHAVCISFPSIIADMTSFRAMRSHDSEARVQDYLNDKLQTTADLNSLDSLLQNVRQQHELLQAQVGISNRKAYDHLADSTRSLRMPAAFSARQTKGRSNTILKYSKKRNGLMSGKQISILGSENLPTRTQATTRSKNLSPS